MGRAKEITVKVIPSQVANAFVAKHHYSKKYVQNSVLHFGCFLDDKLHGVLQYGSPIDKRKCIGFVDTGLSINQGWRSFLELNRMAFDDYLPKNSESRCISISLRLIRKNAPHIKWVLSYADATQCGDGTIYRASGFQLCGIKENKSLLEWNGKVVADKTLNNSNYKKLGLSAGKIKKMGAKPLDGYQIRYIYLLDKSCKIAIPVLPFSMLDDMNARMYKGKKLVGARYV